VLASPTITIYGHMRHTYASLLLQQNESPAYVKEQLGHASIQVTVDVYGHLIPGANRQAGRHHHPPPRRHRHYSKCSVT